jgi:plastocyanin
MNYMKRTLILALSTVMALALSAFAGSLSGKVSGAKNAVVSIDTGKPTPATGKTVTLDQRALKFQPHVLAIQVGTTVQFLNSDSVAHNVYWPKSGAIKANNLGTWPQGQKKPFTFDTPGVVSILCNVHPDMSAYIVISPSPYYAQTDSEGNYKIDNVPDGDYKVTVWGEGAKAQTKPQKVAGDTKADFTVTK